MVGQRRRKFASLVSINERADSLSERLIAAENDLFRRILRLPDSPVSFMEVNLTPEEAKWVDLQVGYAIRENGIDWAIGKAPRMLLASLICTAMRSDSDLSFWPEWAQALGLEHDLDRDKVVREGLSSMMRKAKLNTYEELELGNTSYVSLFQLHAGFPATCLADIVTLHEQRRADGDTYAQDEAEGDFLVSYALHEPTAPRALRNFSRAEPATASAVFARICEFTDHAAEHPEILTDGGFVGTHSLPEIMFAELKDYLLHRDTAPPASDAEEIRFRSPKVVVDPIAGQLLLQLALPSGVNSAEWLISEGDHRKSYLQVAESSTSDQSFHVIRLLNPTPSIEAELPKYNQSWPIDLFPRNIPVAFFSRSTGRLIRSSRKIQAGPVYALAPTGTRFQQRSGSPVTKLSSPVAVDGWTDWFLFSLDLSDSNDVTVAFADDSRTSFVLDKRAKLAFEYPAAIDNLLGEDRRPVYGASPTLTIPDDGSGTWTQRIIYHGPDSESEDVYGEALKCPLGEQFPLLPDSGDAWVGLFEVRLFKNSRFVDSRLINMAEDITLRVDYKGKYDGITFRHDAVNRDKAGLSQATYQLENSGLKTVFHSQGNQAVDSTDIEAPESLRTPYGYTLNCRVVPARLTFQIDHHDATSTWRSFAEALNFDDLDPHGRLSVRVPEKIAQLKLVLIRGQQVLDSLAFTSHSDGSWSLPLHLLLTKISEGSTVLLILQWTFPFSEKAAWRRERMKNQQLPDHRRRRKYHLEDEVAKQQARAEKAHHADLGSIRRESLVNDVKLSGGTLKVTARRPVSTLTVWAWPVFNPSGGATELERHDDNFVLPEEFHQSGPLVVDVHEAAGTRLSLRPVTPSPQSFVVKQPGFWLPEDAPVDVLSLVISKQVMLTEETAEQMARNPRRLVHLWRVHLGLEALRHIRGIAEYVSSINQIVSGMVRMQPRAMLEALGMTSRRFHEKLALFIHIGLVHRRFSTEDTAGDFHSEPWISLLLEIEDLHLLHNRRLSDSDEAEESRGHVADIGGDELLRIIEEGWSGWDGLEMMRATEYYWSINEESSLIITLRGGISPVPQPWGGVNRRRQALVELLQIRSKLNESGIIDKLMPVAEVWHEDVRSVADSPEILGMLDEQRAEINGIQDAQPWVKAPYISSVLATTARLVARGVLTPALSKEELSVWSQLAGLVPQLTLTDLITADALSSHLTRT